MTRRTSDRENFMRIFEEHPFKSCIGTFAAGVSLCYFLCAKYYEDKIDNQRVRYEDKIDNINLNHQQELQIKEISLKGDSDTKYYLNVDKDSELAKKIEYLFKHKENEK